MSTPPSSSLPRVMGSSPAMQRSRVDLPHPDGPTSTRNSPSSTDRFTLRMTSTSPKDFDTSLNSTLAIGSAALFHAAHGDAADHAFRKENEERDGRHHDDRDPGKQSGPVA